MSSKVSKYRYQKCIDQTAAQELSSQFLGSLFIGKNFWKMNFFPGQGKVREFCGRSGKFGKDFESQGKVMEFENKWLH